MEGAPQQHYFDTEEGATAAAIVSELDFDTEEEGAAAAAIPCELYFDTEEEGAAAAAIPCELYFDTEEEGAAAAAIPCELDFDTEEEDAAAAAIPCELYFDTEEEGAAAAAIPCELDVDTEEEGAAAAAIPCELYFDTEEEGAAAAAIPCELYFDTEEEGAAAAVIPCELYFDTEEEGAAAAAIPCEPTNAVDVDNAPQDEIGEWETPSYSPPDPLDCGLGFANSFKVPFHWEGMPGLPLATLKPPVHPPTGDVDNLTKMMATCKMDSSSNVQQNNTGSGEDRQLLPHHQSSNPAHASNGSLRYDNGKRTDSSRGSPNESHSGSPSGACSSHSAGGPAVFRAIRGRQCPPPPPPPPPPGPPSASSNLPPPAPPSGIECSLCAGLGEPRSRYTSHRLSVSGIVTCPRLRNFVCVHCGAKACLKHAGPYCPVSGHLIWRRE